MTVKTTMKWAPWFIGGVIFLAIGGYAGDSIFDPRVMNFSFRVFSMYAIAVLFFCACVAVGSNYDE